MLTSLDKKIKESYRSNENDILNDFILPCLERSILYRRGVGYFTSHSLSLAARGVVNLYKNKGKMRLVASPMLLQEDIDAINNASKLTDDFLLKIANRSFLDLEDFIIKERLNALSWMISSGLLEIKLALPLDHDNKISAGIYHEKVGIFEDINKNTVLFVGSSNETIGGLITNYEFLMIFCSWKGDESRIKSQVEYFDNLWNANIKNLKIINFTEATAEILKPYRLNRIIPENALIYSHDKTKNIITKKFELREYQRTALTKWQDNGFKGILSMCTGSGKTKTALYMLSKFIEKSNLKSRLVTVIVCPFINLINQWEKDMIETFGMNPIKCMSGVNWRKILPNKISEIYSGKSSHLEILVTNDTFAAEDFQKCISSTKYEKFLIVDEAHNIGATETKKCLNESFKYRMALSATPKRHFDEEGTSFLLEYFGGIVFEFSLKDAIFKEKCLSRYRYYPVLVNLTDDEIDRYKEITKKISRIIQSKNTKQVDQQRHLKMLLMQRSKIISDASNKIQTLESLLKSNNVGDIKKAIFFCGDSNLQIEDTNVRYIDALYEVLTKKCNLRIKKFTYEENPIEREEILRQINSEEIDGCLAIRCLDEGIDLPSISKGFIISSTSNPKQFIQRRGRLLRKAKGKEFAEIWDFIVIPPNLSETETGDDQSFNKERQLFLKELARVIDFCETADNQITAMSSLESLRKKYNKIGVY